MTPKKIPLRRCNGCGESKPKKELVRVVRAGDGTVSLDLTGKKPGRGAYVCPSAACLAKARKAGRTTPWPPRSRRPGRKKERRMPGNILFALSLCRKAGALVMGFDAVKDSVGKGKAQLVLCAGDLSEGTRRRVGAFCEDWVEVADLPETQFALAQISKKPTGVFAVTDPELAKLCRKNLAAQAANQKEERPCQ